LQINLKDQGSQQLARHLARLGGDIGLARRLLAAAVRRSAFPPVGPGLSAATLAALTKGLPIKIDLIDVNDPSGKFRPPSAGELDAFRDALRKHVAVPVSRRYSGGSDIAAACGMLAGQRSAPSPD